MALNYLDSSNIYENQGATVEEEEEREAEYANVGVVRSGLKGDPLKTQGAKGRPDLCHSLSSLLLSDKQYVTFID